MHETKSRQKPEVETPEARPSNTKLRMKIKPDYGKAIQKETAPEAEQSKKGT